jgi:hypothetical protein
MRMSRNRAMQPAHEAKPGVVYRAEMALIGCPFPPIKTDKPIEATARGVGDTAADAVKNDVAFQMASAKNRVRASCFY